MARTFIKVNDATAINITVGLGDCVFPDHLARFIVDVIALLDLTALYACYGPRGAPAYAPETLLGLLFYGYATGVFSTRQIAQATYESLPFRAHLRKEVEDVMALGGRAAQGEALPEGLVISEEIVRRQERRTSLAEAKAVIEARAEAR